MAQSPVNNGFLPLSAADLKDPDLWKVNENFQYIYSKVGTIFSPGSTPSYPSTPTFVTVKAAGQAQPPSDPDEFITRRSADALYGPTVQRTALLTGAYAPGSTSTGEINPVQPIPTGGAGTPTPPPPTPGEATILKVTLTGPTTIASPSTPVDGALLAVFVSQDATGHHTISWDATFKGPITAIPGTPSTTDVFWFVGVSSQWWSTSMPVLGVNAVPGGGGGGSVTGVQIKKVLLIAPTVISSPGVPADGAMLAVYVSQDGAGHHTITWASAYQGATTGIPGTPTTTNAFWFVGVSGLWWMTGMPTLNIPGIP